MIGWEEHECWQTDGMAATKPVVAALLSAAHVNGHQNGGALMVDSLADADTLAAYALSHGWTLDAVDSMSAGVIRYTADPLVSTFRIGVQVTNTRCDFWSPLNEGN